MPSEAERHLALLAERLAERPGRRATDTVPLSVDGPIVSRRRAAVALVFRPGPDLLFIRRAQRQGDPWSGHMAFPGGHVEPVDPDPRAAAEREVLEEIGLDLNRGARLLGSLDDRVTNPDVPRHPMAISPFLYDLVAAPALQLNHEVAAVHWFPLARLASGEGRSSFRATWRDDHLEFPCLDLDGQRIWGLTLRMLDDLLALIR